MTKNSAQVSYSLTIFVAASVIGLVEVLMVNLAPPHPPTVDIILLALAAFGGVVLWTLALGVPLIWLIRRNGVIRQALDQTRKSFAWGGGLLLSVAAVFVHVVNATQYVRLYLAIHVLLTIGSVVIAVAAASLMVAHFLRVRSVHPRLLAALQAMALALVLPVSIVASSPSQRGMALEKSTQFAHLLLIARTILPVGSPHSSGTMPMEASAKSVERKAGGFAQGSHVVLITIEAMRGDHFVMTPHRSNMLNMSSMAAEGITFTRAYAPSCWTVHSMSGVLTGRYPSHLRFDGVLMDSSMNFFVPNQRERLLVNPLGKQTMPSPIHDRTPTLAGFLRKARYSALTVPSWEIYHPHAGLTREFEHVDERPVRKLAAQEKGSRRDVELTEPATALLETVIGAHPSKPHIFLWLHYTHPHAPYTARGDVSPTASARERYASELRYVDEEAGKVLEAFRERGLLDNTIVIFHSDHGEEFGEHGGKYHASSVYEEQIHVPLVIRLPKHLEVPRGAVVDTPVSLLDLTPTLLDLLGIDTEASFAGRRITPALLGQKLEQRPVTAECVRWGRHKRAVIDWPHKLIVDDTMATLQLYNLEQDHRERRSLIDDARVQSLIPLLPPPHPPTEPVDE